MNVQIRAFQRGNIAAMIAVWNEVVEEGNAFLQENALTEESEYAFFWEQTCCAVAEDLVCQTILGLYILHPNNIGQCGVSATPVMPYARMPEGCISVKSLCWTVSRKLKRWGFKSYNSPPL